ncbi:reverse transcriptase family protein [Marinicella sp. W31]|uniref:reverse transcriptase family protein n=1 Tax=Marinicella sp. W31 TaxID=3023713 RepID=UPI00375696E6
MKKYDLCNSPFYKLRSSKKLCEILGIKSEKKLRDIINKNLYREKNDGKRIYYIPINSLRSIHDRIHELFSRIKAPFYLHSGVQGKSNVTNACLHAYSDGLIKTDIKNFFPSTNIEKIKRFFLCKMHCSQRVSWLLSKITTFNGTVPIGSPCSMDIAFWTNNEMFEEIEKICKSSKAKFTLYVDDISISMKGLNRRILRRVNSIIKKNGYGYHKERIYKPKKPKVITGVALHEKKNTAVKAVHKKIMGLHPSNPRLKGTKGYIKYIQKVSQ